MPWGNQTYEPSDVKGEIGPRTNERIFELLLRLRANTYWPAMHEVHPSFLSDERESGNGEEIQHFVGASIANRWHVMLPVNGREGEKAYTIT